MGFVITPDGVGMQSDRLTIIEDKPTLKTIRDVQVHLGFANFYRRFIRKYATLTLPFTELLNKADKAAEQLNGRPQRQKPDNYGNVKWEWT